MKKAWWLILLLIPAVHAVTISDWPDFFIDKGKFSAKYVVGEEAPSMDVVSATIISTSLAKFENVTTEVGTSTLDTEIADITRHNAIIVGSPCENRAAYQLMGSPEPCYKDFGGGAGYIKVYENNGRVQLLITGFEAEDRQAAAKFLARSSLASINTNEYTVSSSSGSKPPYFNRTSQSAPISANVTNVTSTANVTPVETVTTVEKTGAVQPGEYEPLNLEEFGKLPREETGFWESIWNWLKSLFT